MVLIYSSNLHLIHTNDISLTLIFTRLDIKFQSPETNENTMSSGLTPFIPVIAVSAFWFVVGAIAPCFVRGHNRQIIRVCLTLTAVCCWLFWLCTYLSQLNPLQGPLLKAEEALGVVKQWQASAKKPAL